MRKIHHKHNHMKKNNRQNKIIAIKEALNSNPEKLREIISNNTFPSIYFIDKEKGTATNPITKEVISVEEHRKRTEIYEELTGEKCVSINFNLS